MANLVRRDDNDVSKTARNEYRWDPFRMMDTLLRWDPFRSELGPLGYGGDFTPRFDVKETKDAYVIKADLPGVKEGDLSLSLTGNQLTISGKREEERREEAEQYYTLERTSGTFARVFSLPPGVDPDQVTADLKDGVLEVRIPKRPEAQPKKIAVSKGPAPDSGSASS